MSIVSRPYVLDFAGAYLDQPPDYPEDVLAEWRDQKREQFGAHWPDVQSILYAFSRLGIHIADVNPDNIAFREQNHE